MTPAGFDALPVIWDAAIHMLTLVSICTVVLAVVVGIGFVIGRRA